MDGGKQRNERKETNRAVSGGNRGGWRCWERRMLSMQREEEK